MSHEITIEAAGYRSIRTPLAVLLGGKDWPLRKRHFDLKIWMIQDDQPQAN